MTGDSKLQQQTSHRRNFLKIAGTVGTLTLAGCSELNSNSEPTDNSSGETENQGNGSSGGDGYSARIGIEFSESNLELIGTGAATLLDEFESLDQMNTEFYPSGELGSGIALMRQLNQGTVDIIDINLANVASFVEVADVINLPYLASQNEDYMALVYSDIWQELVEEPLIEQGFRPLYYPLLDSRQVGFGSSVVSDGVPPRSLDEMDGIVARVPGSNLLQKMWRLLGANPTPIDWGETPQALDEGTADTVHTAIQWWEDTGMNGVLAAGTYTHMIPDSHVWLVSERWWQDLPEELQTTIMDDIVPGAISASIEETETGRLDALEACMEEGMEFHNQTDAEREAWQEACGYHLSEWEEDIEDIVGDMETFEEIEAAAKSDPPFDDIENAILANDRDMLEERGTDTSQINIH